MRPRRCGEGGHLAVHKPEANLMVRLYRSELPVWTCVRTTAAYCPVADAEAAACRLLLLHMVTPLSLNLSDTRRILHSTLYFKVEKVWNTEAGKLNMFMVRLFYLFIGVNKEVVCLSMKCQHVQSA